MLQGKLHRSKAKRVLGARRASTKPPQVETSASFFWDPQLLQAMIKG